MNSSTETQVSTDINPNLAGKVATGMIVCIAIFLNAFVFLVALFSKSLRKNGYNLTTISLSFTDFLVGVSIRPLISFMSNTYSVRYNSCAVALAAYTICVQASSFHVLIIGCLRCYAIKNNNLTVFKFQVRNAIMVIISTWFLAIFSTTVMFLLLTSKNELFVLCTLKNLFGEEYKLFLKLHSIILVSCGLVLICMYVILGTKLYSSQTSVNSVHPLNIENLRYQTRTNETCTVHNDDVSNSSLVTIREMASCKTLESNREVTEKNDQQKQHRNATIQTCVDGGQIAILPIRLRKLDTNNDSENPEPSPSSHTQRYMPCVEKPELPNNSSENEVELLQSRVNCAQTELTTQIKENHLSSIPDRKNTCSSQTNKQRESKSSNKVKSRQLTKFPNTRHRKSIVTVFIIVLLHLILNGPFYLYLFVEGFLMRETGDSVVRTILFCISTLHTVLNPVIYVVRIPEFREFIKDKVNYCKQCVNERQA